NAESSARYWANVEEERAYHREWKRERAKDPAFRAAQAKRQRERRKHPVRGPKDRAQGKLRYHTPAGLIRAMLVRAKGRAKLRGRDVTITAQDVRDVWPADNRCPVTGLELKASKSGKLTAASPALDEIRIGAGYVRGNVQVISHAANVVKGNKGLEHH